jgi:hypothetical protein
MPAKPQPSETSSTVDVELADDIDAQPPAMAQQQATFHPRDTIGNTGSTILQTTAIGAIIAGVQNTLRKQNVGAMGIITRSGGIIALYGAHAVDWLS